MCGIIGYINFENASKKTIDSMKKISYRGKDSYGIFDGKNIHIAKTILELQSLIPEPPTPNPKLPTPISIGHLLHSIVDFVPQPIKGKGVLVSNCEIYNWETLAKKHKIKSKNDSELLLKILDKTELEDKEIQKFLNELDGDYAIVYLRDGKLILARDVIGVKPLCYFHQNQKFAFASELKALPEKAVEINPREYLIYDIKTDKINIYQRDYYKTHKGLNESYDETKEKIKALFFDAVIKRIPKNKKIGLLFSGGTDSTLIALTLKELGIDFTCYTTNIKGGDVFEGEDLKYAREIAKECNLNLKISQTDISEIPQMTKEVMEIIESKEYVKVSVALSFYAALKEAKKDDIKVIFSGIGSEELFADYKRYRQVEIDEINQICLEGLMSLWIRDLYRDDVLAMHNNIELRVPFLDKKLITYSMQVKPEYKIDKKNDRNKIILRDILKGMNLSEGFAERRKKAAQYGSKSDRILAKLAKQKKMKKQEYLDSL